MNYFTDRFTITKRSKSPEGYLLVTDSKLARVGVLNYRFGELGSIDGAPDTLTKLDAVRVYRGPEELFKSDVLDSFKAKPVTLTHPGELVDASTFKDTSVGFAKDDLTSSGDFITASLLITDADAIKAVEDGTKELSLGYTARITWQPGTAPDGSVYDAVQTEIRGNHIAIVPRGRCGSVCTLSDSLNKTNKKEGTAMDEIILDGVTYECPAQTKQAFTKVNDALKVSLKDAEDKKDKSEKELEDEKETSKKDKDEMQAKLDASEENKIKDSDIDALVEERSQLVSDAQSIVKDMDCKGLSTADIKLAVVTDACPNAKPESLKSADYVAARFDGLLEDAPKGSAIKDAMTAHADSTIIVNDGLSLSQRKRQDKINNNKKR